MRIQDALKERQHIHSGQHGCYCDVCHEIFALHCTVKSYHCTHGTECPHTCDVCNISFSKRSVLKTHQLIHGEQCPFSCKEMDPIHLLLILAVVVVLLLPFLYDSHGAFHYHSRFIIYIVVVSATALICIPLYCLSPQNVRNAMYTSCFLKHITKLLGIRWELRGRELLAEERGCVIVANHQSILDVLGMFNIWQVMDKCAPVAKKELFYVWPFGLGAWLSGIVFIDRLNSKKAHEQLANASKLMKKHKIKLWMFPEGTRNPSRTSLMPFKKGAFRVAITCQVPILPVVYSPYYFINDEKKYFGQGKMIIQALPEIPTEGLTLDDMDLLMERTRRVMCETFESLVTEVNKQ